MSGARDDLSAFAEWFDDMLVQHGEHAWHKVGRCVYCGPCGVRLYQGDLPDGHPVWRSPRRPSPGDQMRDRWDMDRRPAS